MFYELIKFVAPNNVVWGIWYQDKNYGLKQIITPASSDGAMSSKGNAGLTENYNRMKKSSSTDNRLDIKC